MTQDAHIISYHIITEKMKMKKKSVCLHDLDDKKLKNTRPVRKERKKPSNWQEPAAAIEDFKVVRFDFISQFNGKLL